MITVLVAVIVIVEETMQFRMILV